MILTVTVFYPEAAIRKWARDHLIRITRRQATPVEVLLPGLPEAIREDLPEVLPEQSPVVLRNEEEGSGAAVLTDIPDIGDTRVTNRRFYVD